MRIGKKGALPVFAALALACALPPLAAALAPSGAQPETAAVQEQVSEQATPLFGALELDRVSDVVVAADERTFHFALNDGEVSVNGQMADEEVFTTLLSQIAALPVAGLPAFAEEGEPILTLTVNAGGEELCARFYRDDPQQFYAQVVCDADGAVRYGVTKAWRVGKLVLTCDGTRIQDASGHETPAQ